MTRTCPHCGKPIMLLEQQEYLVRFHSRRALNDPGSNEARAMRLAQSECGVTDDEVSARLGLKHKTATPMMRYLRIAGLIEFTGETRLTRSGKPAMVNRAVDAARGGGA